MRNLIKNERKFYILKYLGEVDTLDEEGYKTGEKTISYSKPIMVMGNISSARGSSQIEMFGTDENYDKTIVISKAKYDALHIAKDKENNSVLFVDKSIAYDNDTKLPLYDYRVIRVAETLNQVAIAIKRV